MVILITGASRGIGLATAEAFAAKGHKLIIHSKKASNLEQAGLKLQERYPDSVIAALPADLTHKLEVVALFKEIEQLHKPVDVLVNNAGFFLPGSIHQEAEGTLTAMLEANLFSVYHLTRLLLPGMMRRRSGYIFNICSIAAQQAYPNGGSYGISKFALLGMGKNLREELKHYNIKVTNVLPGATYTDSWKASGLPETRFMQASDVARMILTCTQLSDNACVEEIVMRPQLGDL